MLYPVVIHKDPDSCYGVTIPDIPGCFTAGDSLDEATSNVQEAVECHLHGSDTIPEPSDIEKHMNDPLYKDGIWVMVDVDMAFLSKKHVRVNITVPENILHQIDEAAKKKHMSRSSFLVFAAQNTIKSDSAAPASGSLSGI